MAAAASVNSLRYNQNLPILLQEACRNEAHFVNRALELGQRKAKVLVIGLKFGVAGAPMIAAFTAIGAVTIGAAGGALGFVAEGAAMISHFVRCNPLSRFVFANPWTVTVGFAAIGAISGGLKFFIDAKQIYYIKIEADYVDRMHQTRFSSYKNYWNDRAAAINDLMKEYFNDEDSGFNDFLCPIGSDLMIMPMIIRQPELLTSPNVQDPQRFYKTYEYATIARYLQNRLAADHRHEVYNLNHHDQQERYTRADGRIQCPYSVQWMKMEDFRFDNELMERLTGCTDNIIRKIVDSRFQVRDAKDFNRLKSLAVKLVALESSKVKPNNSSSAASSSSAVSVQASHLNALERKVLSIAFLPLIKAISNCHEEIKKHINVQLALRHTQGLIDDDTLSSELNHNHEWRSIDKNLLTALEAQAKAII
jgi:hypothetical protein